PGRGNWCRENRHEQRRRRSTQCHERSFLIRGASPLGLPYTRPRSPLRRLAPVAWLASLRSRASCLATPFPPAQPLRPPLQAPVPRLASLRSRASCLAPPCPPAQPLRPPLQAPVACLASLRSRASCLATPCPPAQPLRPPLRAPVACLASLRSRA